MAFSLDICQHFPDVFVGSVIHFASRWIENEIDFVLLVILCFRKNVIIIPIG